MRLHDPATISMCQHSDSPLPCNKLLKVKTFYNYRSCIFRFIRCRILCCHFYVGHFAVSVYITSTGMCHPLTQWCHLAKAIWNLIGQQKNFASEMRKKLNCSQLLSLRNFFARTLCKLSLRMPVTYFARTFSHFAEFFLTGN